MSNLYFSSVKYCFLSLFLPLCPKYVPKIVPKSVLKYWVWHMHYLKQKRGIWHFRIIIPEDVRGALKSGKEIMRSLQTTSRREAAAKVAPHIQEWTAKIELARKAQKREIVFADGSMIIRKSDLGFDLETESGVVVKSRPLNVGFVQELSRQWFRTYWFDFFGNLDRTNLNELEINERLPHSSVRQSILEFYENNRQLIPSMPRFITTCLSILNSEFKYDVNKVNPSAIFSDDIGTKPENENIEYKSEDLFEGTLISEAVEEYFNRINKKPEKTILLFRARVALFIDFLGHDARLSDISRKQAEQFRLELRKYPARKPKKINGFRKALLWATENDTPFLKAGAINAYTDAIRAVFMPACKRLKIPNPFSNLEIAKDTDSGSTRYKDFTSEEITKLFGSTFCQKRKNFDPRPSDFWIMLALLLHGSRINEWAQAKPEQFFMEDGIFCFEIRGRTKTISSERKIPIHPVLLNLGFKDFHSKCKTPRLFPDLIETQEGQFSSGLSKRFNHYIDLCQIVDPRKVAHSFRHTWITRARLASMSEEERHYLVGHKNQGQGSKYGSYPVSKLYSEISKIEFAIDLDSLKKVRDSINGCV